ncbi:hypothetical protein EJ06DRAFT_265445 [Trichodelitschia bisporula]|uniref:Uncharacterized protein n=1 Tax=Trichodelitschia bisporula TaxID=703511 RepID=A0A6G1HIM8_9PEZI|nr:hypothetical protein EJ06DRAFT_265445 [Trichodelitschia bisporula]
MVQIANAVTAVLAAAAAVDASPLHKRAQQYPSMALTITQANGTSATTSLNWEAAIIGGGLLATLGATIGGILGAFMPANTTFTFDSILTGLGTEVSQFSTWLSSTGGIPMIPGLDLLGGLGAGSVPGGLPGFGGGAPAPPFTTFPGAAPTTPAAAAAPTPAAAVVPKPAAPTPVAAAPKPPVAAAPAPKPPVVPAAPPKAVTPVAAATPKPAAPAPQPAMGGMSGMSGMGGHSHGPGVEGEFPAVEGGFEVEA